MQRLHKQIEPFQSGAQTDKNFLFYISRFWFVIFTPTLHTCGHHSFRQFCKAVVTIYPTTLVFLNSSPFFFSNLLLEDETFRDTHEHAANKPVFCLLGKSFLYFISFWQSVINWYTWFQYKRGYKFFCLAIRPMYKGIQDSLGFWIPRRGFRIPGTGLQSLSVELGFWIPNVN